MKHEVASMTGRKKKHHSHHNVREVTGCWLKQMPRACECVCVCVASWLTGSLLVLHAVNGTSLGLHSHYRNTAASPGCHRDRLREAKTTKTKTKSRECRCLCTQYISTWLMLRVDCILFTIYCVIYFIFTLVELLISRRALSASRWQR